MPWTTSDCSAGRVDREDARGRIRRTARRAPAGRRLGPSSRSEAPAGEWRTSRRVADSPPGGPRAPGDRRNRSAADCRPRRRSVAGGLPSVSECLDVGRLGMSARPATLALLRPATRGRPSTRSRWHAAGRPARSQAAAAKQYPQPCPRGVRPMCRMRFFCAVPCHGLQSTRNFIVIHCGGKSSNSLTATGRSAKLEKLVELDHAPTSDPSSTRPGADCRRHSACRSCYA